MTQDAPGPTRRRRRRGSSPAGPPAASPPSPTVSAPAPATPPGELPPQPPRSEPPRPHVPHPEAPHTAPVHGGIAATTPARDPDGHHPGSHLDEHYAEPGPSRGRRASDPGGTRDPAERGMRDLVGAGHSQVGVDGALRARDVNRPSAEDLAEAERTVTIVRRHWKPPS